MLNQVAAGLLAMGYTLAMERDPGWPPPTKAFGNGCILAHQPASSRPKMSRAIIQCWISFAPS